MFDQFGNTLNSDLNSDLELFNIDMDISRHLDFGKYLDVDKDIDANEDVDIDKDKDKDKEEEKKRLRKKAEKEALYVICFLSTAYML